MTDQYEAISDEAIRLAEDIKANLHGENTHDAIEAMIVVVSDLIVSCAYDLKSAEAASNGFIASVLESIRVMDQQHVCCWSEKPN